MKQRRFLKVSKIYVFDLDHTLCHVEFIDNYRWDYQNATPFKERIAIGNKLYEQGHQIIIDSARGSNSGKDWKVMTNKQLESWGLKFHILRTGVKFPADHYIDDKAISDKEFFDDLND